jgi:hypothetical protein
MLSGVETNMETPSTLWFLDQPKEAKKKKTLYTLDAIDFVCAVLFLYQLVLKMSSSESVENECMCWAARDPSGLLSPHTITRR